MQKKSTRKAKGNLYSCEGPISETKVLGGTDGGTKKYHQNNDKGKENSAQTV